MWQGGPTKAAEILGKSSAHVRRGDAVGSRTVLEVKARIACMYNVAF